MGFASGVLQIHPLRRCNLACLHCYSSSGPRERDSLALPLLEAAVDQAAALGWRYASVSGGEPLLYPDLRALLFRARSVGLSTAITTNGTLLDRVAPIADLLDLVAISLDGVGEDHDRMRARVGAFDQLVGGLPALRETGVPFAFLWTLTQDNVDQLEAVARFAANAGASALQVHPLAPAGRGRDLGSSCPDDEVAARAWLEVWRLRSSGSMPIPIRLDLADLHGGAPLDPTDVVGADPAEVLSPLVIEADGTVVPLQHGFPRPWALGSLHERSLTELVLGWPRLAEFRSLCAATLRRLATERDLPFVDPYREIALAAA